LKLEVDGLGRGTGGEAVPLVGPDLGRAQIGQEPRPKGRQQVLQIAAPNDQAAV